MWTYDLTDHIMKDLIIVIALATLARCYIQKSKNLSQRYEAIMKYFCLQILEAFSCKVSLFLFLVYLWYGMIYFIVFEWYTLGYILAFTLYICPFCCPL